MASDLSFFDKLQLLEEILVQHHHVPSALDDIQELLRDADVRREFFRNLDNPDWITPLKNAGYFHYPRSLRDSRGATIPPVYWPESKYLARMAKQTPDDVASIFAELEIDKPLIVGNMLDAAKKMPSNIAAMLVPAICRAVSTGIMWNYFNDTTDLCVRLAEDGEVSAALQLADELFAPKDKDHQGGTIRTDKYWYKEELSKVLPLLTHRESRTFLVMLCDWLQANIETKQEAKPEPGTDYSYLWRPAIEEHGQNRDYDSAGIMVGFVREGFELAIGDGDLPLQEGIKIIDRYPYLVFRRIRLHLINEFADTSSELARLTMMDQSLFDNHKFKHEYAMLMERRMDLLNPEQRATWFGWLDAGPKVSETDETAKNDQDSDETKVTSQEKIRYWQFSKLHWVRNHLEGKHKSLYEQMLTEHGVPELADLNCYVSAGSWGHQSPMTVEELEKLTFREAVEKVSSWKLEDETRHLGPDIEGLASTFEKYVETDPKKFSSMAGELKDRPAIFVSGFINQMCDAIKSVYEIDLIAVLELCSWVIKQPLQEITNQEKKQDPIVNQDWQWTRNEISRLLQNVCNAGAQITPRYSLEGLRDPIWELIERLCRDPSDSNMIRNVSLADPRVSDYFNLGINSPRGIAVEAALVYARWVADHLKTSDGIVPEGFDKIPGFQDMLDWQISPENRNKVTMSVIGAHINKIYGIDKEWLASNADRLFHLQGIEEIPPETEGWAAWNAFLVWVNHPHIEYFRTFENQYTYAVQQASQVDPSDDSREQPMHRLGEHLMILYGRGHLDLQESEGLLQVFLTTAKPEYRRHSITFVGEILRENKTLPPDIVEKFKSLWETYWSGAGKKDAEDNSGGQLFGTWFPSAHLPELWALKHLEQFVEVAPNVESGHSVLEHLSKIASTDIACAVRCLDKIVVGDRKGWRIFEKRDEIRQILELAMNAGGDAQDQAKQTINYLGRRGRIDLGKLLKVG